jgi:hypothetical protein
MKALEIAPAADTIDPVFAAVLARTPEKAIVMQHSGEGKTSLTRACPARCAHLQYQFWAGKSVGKFPAARAA